MKPLTDKQILLLARMYFSPKSRAYKQALAFGKSVIKQTFTDERDRIV